MNTKQYLITLLLLTYTWSFAQPPEGPAGIFVIGDTRSVPTEIEKFDLDCVAGYTLRIPWADMVPVNFIGTKPTYDFSRIDIALENLRSRNKQMTLEVFIDKVPPYILTLPGVATWNNPNPNQGGTQVVPWDITALTEYQRMVNEMANHVVAGTTWKISEHPTLQSVDAPIVGLQGLRELSNTLIKHPDYTRTKFVQSIVDSVTASRQAFPQKYGFIALFAMSDTTTTPALDQTVYDTLMVNFNVNGKPSLGFFQETLSDASPKPTSLGKFLAAGSTKTYTLFQALKPWTLAEGVTRTSEIASGTPITGIKYAWDNYGTTYVELYGPDVLNTNNQTELKKWNNFFRKTAEVRGNKNTPKLNQDSSKTLTLTWDTDPLLQYKVYQSNDLATWNEITNIIPNGNTTLPTFTGSRSFYRIEILPP
jgi:hypothetical protein